MYTLAVSFPAVAVSAIYCLWYAYQQNCLRRERLLCERVAYMLWVAAHLPEEPEDPVPVQCGPGEATPLYQRRCPPLLAPPEAPRRQRR
jgi:hypothetical protein